MIWPSDVAVPMRRTPDRTVRIGVEEGQLCLRADGGFDPCLGIIEHIRDLDRFGGCSCHISPPCGYCLSTMPECPKCGWREE